MPLFLIHLVPNEESSPTKTDGHSAERGNPVCLVDCQQIVHEPVISPDTSEIVDNSKPNSLQTTKNNEQFRARKLVKITPISQTDSESPSTDEGEIDSRTLITERNLIYLVANQSGEEHWTMELHFNLGFDRFFVVGSPCKLLIAGALRLHKPCLEVTYGLNMLNVCEDSMIYVNDAVIDVYAKIETFDHVPDRSILVYSFYGTMPKLDAGVSEVGSGEQNNMEYPDYVIYFIMNGRPRPVAIFSGEVQTPPADVFKPFDVVMYLERKFGPVVNSELKLTVVMSDAKRKDRKFILNHVNLTTVTFLEDTVCHVCSLKKAFFSFSQSSIKIGGFVAVHSATGNQLVSGRTTVVVKAGQALLYVDDYFAILSVGEDTEYEVEHSYQKQKDLKSISLMNTNKKPQRLTLGDETKN